MRAATRYVKSLLTLAEEQNALEAVHQDMKLFSAVVAENRELGLILKNPIIRHEKKREILEKIFTGKVHPLTLAIFDILTRKNRENILAEIAVEFHLAYNRVKGITMATLTTATPIDESVRAEMKAMVNQISKKVQVEMLERIDPTLVGGFVLKVGDRQVDASLRSRLAALKVMFSTNPYIKEF